MAKRLEGGRKVRLDSYFYSAQSRTELVSMFLAMLELLKSGVLVLEEGEDAVDDDGVIDAVSGVSVSLEASADISQLTEIVKDE